MTYMLSIESFNDGFVVKPFSSAEEAWFWCCRVAYEMPMASDFVKDYIRPCEANDLYIIMKKLKDEGELRAAHIKVMIEYGKKQVCPEIFFGASSQECMRWREAMSSIETRLREKKIVR